MWALQPAASRRRSRPRTLARRPCPTTSTPAELGVASPRRRLPLVRQRRAAGGWIWLSVVPPGLSQWAQMRSAASLRRSLSRWAVRAAQSGLNSEMYTLIGSRNWCVLSVVGHSG
ncbi:hypothetical protein NN561_015290 [Cricetulus griseus]